MSETPVKPETQILYCPLLTAYEKRITDAFVQISESHQNTKELLDAAKHLKALDALIDIRDHLLNAATGKGYTDNETVKLIVKILGAVIILLILYITGQQFNFAHLFGLK